MSEEQDYILNISGSSGTESGRESSNGSSTLGHQIREAEISNSKAANRKYISVLFECCRVYHRIYRNRSGTAYEGRCPRCLAPVKVRIGNGGVNCRFFSAK